MTQQAKMHTPGPWRAEPCNGGGAIAIRAADDRTIAIMAGSGKEDAERDANADVIVRALAMQEALRKIANDDYTDEDGATLYEQPTMIWQAVARAALGTTEK